MHLLSLELLGSLAASLNNQPLSKFRTNRVQALRYSDVAHAMRTRQESLVLCRELEYQLGIAWGEWELGEVYQVEQDLDAAIRHYRRAEGLFEQIQLERGIAFVHRGLGDIAQALEDYAEAQKQFQIYLEQAAREPNLWSTSYALSGLGRVAAGLQQLEEAQRRFSEALELANKIGASELCMVALVGLIARGGETEMTAEAAAFVANHYISWRQTKQQAASALAAATADLPAHVAESAMERGKRGDLETLIARLRST